MHQEQQDRVVLEVMVQVQVHIMEQVEEEDFHHLEELAQDQQEEMVVVEYCQQ